MPLIRLPKTKHNLDDFGLNPTILDALWHMEDTHFWHKARNRWIKYALKNLGLDYGAKILEVGCGAGAVSCYLHQEGYEIVGVDTAEVLVEKANQRCPDAVFICGDVADLPEEFQGPYDAICFFDVLEHLDNPESLLQKGMKFLRPGGFVLASMPGMQEMYDHVDELSGHKKRYNPGEATKLFENVGLADVKEYGLFRGTTKLLRMFRKTDKVIDVSKLSEAEKVHVIRRYLKTPASVLNLTLAALCCLEVKLGLQRAMNKTSATILCIGQKRSGGAVQ